MRDSAISVSDLNQLSLWVEAQPRVPEGDWYKDFGFSNICGSGSYPKRSYSEGKSPRVKPSDHRASADSSPAAKKRLIARNGEHPPALSV